MGCLPVLLSTERCQFHTISRCMNTCIQSLHEGWQTSSTPRHWGCLPKAACPNGRIENVPITRCLFPARKLLPGCRRFVLPSAEKEALQDPHALWYGR